MKRSLLWIIVAVAALIANDFLLLHATGFFTHNNATIVAAKAAGSKLPAIASMRSIQTFDHIVYSDIHCSADWDQDCFGSIPVDAIPGWQICKPVWGNESHGGSAGYWFSATEYFAGDTTNPRFKRLLVWIKVSGSHDWFNRTGSNQNFQNLGARLINDSATVADRVAAGCMVP